MYAHELHEGLLPSRLSMMRSWVWSVEAIAIVHASIAVILTCLDCDLVVLPGEAKEGKGYTGSGSAGGCGLRAVEAIETVRASVERMLAGGESVGRYSRAMGGRGSRRM